MDVKKFRGLNTVTDPLRLGLDWLVQADNVHITETGAINKRDGYALSRSGALISAYSTLNFQRIYTSDLLSVKDSSGSGISPVSSSAPMYWAEVNEQVFYNNGTDDGIILPDDRVLPWRWATPTAPSVGAATGNLPAGTYQVRCTYLLDDGRETGTGEAAEITLAEGQALRISSIPQVSGAQTNVYIAPADSTVYQLFATTRATALVFNTSPDTLGRELLNAFLDPLPENTDVIQFWRGRAYAAQYMASENQTVVWFSEALGFHLFNLNSNFFIVPGKVTMLAPNEAALLVGTDSRIYAYDGQKISQLAEFGVTPGVSWAKDDDRILMWTTRGVCQFPSFKNLTLSQVSVAPGVRAGCCVIQRGGQKRFVAAIQQGGSPFNAL